jgi:hypothetical protein
MVWYVAVIVETFVCGWVQLERRALRRRADAAPDGSLPPIHRLYGRVLGRIGHSGRGRKPRIEQREARRRTGLVQFGIATVAMLPIFLFVAVDGFHMSPAVGQLVAWPLLWLSPLLTLAPARLIALLVAVWRGWVRLDDGDGGSPTAASPVPGAGPDSHLYLLPR